MIIDSEMNFHPHCAGLMADQPQLKGVSLFSPLNMPVAFLMVPRDALGCGETQMNTDSNSIQFHMCMIR